MAKGISSAKRVSKQRRGIKQRSAKQPAGGMSSYLKFVFDELDETLISEPSAVANFEGAFGLKISRNEIYHRLEWFFIPAHNPAGPHRINPNAPIEQFFNGMDPLSGRGNLWVRLNKASQTFIPAWNSQLFHGIQLPWESRKDVSIGIRDVKKFGDLLRAYEYGYIYAGYAVD